MGDILYTQVPATWLQYGRKVQIVDADNNLVSSSNPLPATATITGDVNVDSTSVSTSGIIGKESGTNADFTTAYAGATTLTCSSLPSGVTAIKADDIVSIVQVATAGSVTNTYTRDDVTITTAGTDPTTITVTGAAFVATDSFIVYTNIPQTRGDKVDLIEVAGTAINVNGGNRDAGTQTVTLADDDPAVVDLAAIEVLNTTIAGDTTSIDTKTPALGTAAMAASTPVTIASDDTLTSAANALLTTIDADTSTIAGDTTSLDTKAPALGTAAMVASRPVTIASDDTLTAAANALLTTIDSDTNDIKTSVELIDDAIGTVDESAGIGAKGVFMLGIRNDTPATPLVDTDKDFTTFSFNSQNELITSIPSNGNDDEAFTVASSQVNVMGAVYTTTPVSTADDQGALSMTIDRKLRTENHTATAVPESGTDAVGADAYATVLTPSTAFSNIMISNEGSNPATVSIDAGTTDNFIRIPGNCVQTFEGITITAVAIQAKNASAGNNYSNLTITVW
jgi:hypothetical protein